MTDTDPTSSDDAARPDGTEGTCNPGDHASFCCATPTTSSPTSHKPLPTRG